MREHDPLTDSALDRELQELLSVNPSANFGARVQTAVSRQQPQSTLGGIWFVGSLVAATAATVFAISMSMHRENVNIDAEPRAVVLGRDIELPLASATRPLDRTTQHVTTNPSPRAPRTSPSAVVMVWPEDAKGLDELIRDITQRRFEIGGDGSTLPPEASLVSSADIAPIVFEPIELSPMEGVFQ